MSRYKSAADNSEKIEDELKAEKRKLQREVRTQTGRRFSSVNRQRADCNVSPLSFSAAAHGSRQDRGDGDDQQPPSKAPGEDEGQQERSPVAAVRQGSVTTEALKTRTSDL